MQPDRRAFLEELLDAPGPSGYETEAQRRFIEYITPIADAVRTDAYGNAVGVYNQTSDGPSIAFAGHMDEIGLIVSSIDEDGFVHVGSIGGMDRMMTKGRAVEIHTATGPVTGVVGQTAVHLREQDDDEIDDIEEQYIDIGVESAAAARERISVGDPITVVGDSHELADHRLAARAMDNRVGVWAAAEGFRQAVDGDIEATIYTISTVQEEIGTKGAEMIGADLELDAVLAIDVTNAVDTPGIPAHTKGEVELGSGPVIYRGSANHPVVVDALRAAAAHADIDIQLASAGNRTATDADAFYRQQAGTPAVNVGIPNRYMHTPVEVIDTTDLGATVELLTAFADRAEGYDTFEVDL
ncbi:MAG: M20/M25/M40 family metallo-hydrolase [Halobacteriales archaeon]|nr:M20/M25/M40 family metallo-hydrolase [Halobacteriales archaeon]